MGPRIVRSSFARRIACASALALLLGPAGPSAGRLERRVEAAPGGAVHVDLFAGGDVDVRGGSVDGVLVRASGGGPGSPVEVRVEGDLVRVVSAAAALPGARVEIEVPGRFDVRVRAAGGDVGVRGVDGRVVAETQGGDLAAEDVAGSVELVTAGGDVVVRGVTASVRVQSSGGDVRLDGVTGEADVTTMGGEIVAVGPVRSAFELRTTGGDVEVDEAPAGSVLETLGGEIRVRRAAGELTVETSGGNVEIGGAHGSLRATTLSGSVRAAVVGRPGSVRIDARHGDVRLTVPARFDARWDVDVSWSRGSGGERGIDSDVPLEIRRSAGREASGGEARQYATGRGRTGSGATDVEVRVLNGDVTIREAR